MGERAETTLAANPSGPWELSGRERHSPPQGADTFSLALVHGQAPAIGLGVRPDQELMWNSFPFGGERVTRSLVYLWSS